ncbi:MAG: hypothetical protein J6D04_05505 [Clostridia bacterium]|nr:hypothetical protein [Clostridia bacterium]
MLSQSGRVSSIPKTLKECYEENELVARLWKTCDNIEFVGRIIFGVVLIIGFIVALVFGIYDGAIGEFVIVFAISFVGALFECLIYKFIAMRFASLASLVQNTRISANVTLYRERECVTGEVVKNKVEAEVQEIENADEQEYDQESWWNTWQCNKCSHANPVATEVCEECGAKKPII